MSSPPAWLLKVVTCLIVLQITCFISESSAAPNEDKITSLPGQPPVEFKQYAGYVEVGNKSLFYYFVEAETNPQTKPLVLWLNGGPGCSSLDGAFNGHGPFKIKGQLLVKNNFSWNQGANMLFLESPSGVGFSFSSSNMSSFTNDEITAQENLEFLFGWLEKFPEYKNKDLFLTGLSYAGHYIPQVANLVLESRLKSNLKGIALGNPLLDFDIDYNARADFLWSHGLVSDSTFSMANSLCNVSQISKQMMQPQGNLSAACSKVYNQGIAEIGIFVNLYSVLINKCGLRGGSEADVCSDVQVYKYLNKKGVQEALHAKLVGVKEWITCNFDIGYVQQDALLSTLPLLGKLVKSGVQVMVFSGDQDSIIPFIGTRRLIKSLAEILGLNSTVPYTSWMHNKQVGGWTQVYGDILSFATVRGGGHDSLVEQPERTLAVFNSFLQGKPLPVAPTI